jgi:hypothetical protein
VADEVYRPISDNDEETPPPSVDFKIDSYSDFQRALKEHVGASDHDLSSEEVADDITPRRQREEAPTPENASERPLVRMRSTKDSLSLQEASDDIRFSRARQQGADLSASGYTQDQINEYARVKIEASLDGQPDNPDPPVEVKLLDHFGEAGEPLTASEAAEKLSSWREEQERQRQAELVELVGPQEQAQAELQAQQPIEPQQQQPQAPDQIQTERAQLARERAWVTQLAKMSGQEAALRNDLSQLGAAILQEFPSLRNGPPNPADVENLRQTDPARHQKLMMADQMVRERQQKIAAVMQQQQAHEAQQTKAYEAQLAEARARQDADFNQRAARLVPNFEQQRGEIQAAAMQTLQAAGLSRQDITNLWSGTGHLVDMHSAAAQELLLKAALYDRMQARAHEIRQAPVPPVIRPGTYRARDDGAQSVRELQMRLDRASGREAIRIGAELTRAKRANGG